MLPNRYTCRGHTVHRATDRERESRTPLYRQVANNLQEGIEKGLFRPGVRILTEYELREKSGLAAAPSGRRWLSYSPLRTSKPATRQRQIRTTEYQSNRYE